MFTAALFTGQKVEASQGPTNGETGGWLDGRTNKMGYFHPYSGIPSGLKQEIPTDSTTGVSLEGMTRSEISSSQKDKC